MNQRDQQLLDKQLWGVSSRPPRNADIIGPAFVIVFLVGIAIGNILSAHEGKPMQTASHDLTVAR